MRICLREHSSGRVFPLQGERAVIGSSARCEIVLDADQVAPEHARVSVGSVGIELDDLGSPGGTLVNGHRAGKHFIGPGDRLQLGEAVLVVDISKESPPAPPEVCRRCGVELPPGIPDTCRRCRQRPSRRLPRLASSGATPRPGAPAAAPAAPVAPAAPAADALPLPLPNAPASFYETPPDPEARDSHPTPLPGPPPFSAHGLLMRRVLGKGSQGTVYAMEHVDHGLVAVKHVGNCSGTVRKRFLREAAALSELQHPHIVRQLETIEDDEGGLLIVLEYVEGPSLRKLIQAGELTPSQTLTFAHQIAQAVAYASAKGIFNRDIKPGNILVDGGGRAKLTDFGLAIFQEDTGTRLTLEGQWVGTPYYMAPEQIDGWRGEPTTDVYGFGATFFEALTGAPPFRCKTAAELFMRILDQEPDCTELRARIGDAGAELFGRLLAKLPEDRPPPAELPALIAALRTRIAS